MNCTGSRGWKGRGGMKDEHAAGQRRMTVVHVTHESIHQLGGIGTVLEGVHTAEAWRREVGRSVLVGPLPYPDARVADPIERLGPHASACLYSGPDQFDPNGLGSMLRPIEWAFNVRIVYGRRSFRDLAGRTGDAELLLIDVSQASRERVNAFKWLLYEKLGLDSHRYETTWDYEEWVRLAEPAYHALCALLNGDAAHRGPALLIAHEYMGLPTAFRCGLDRARFRTLFHAHECSTARRLVEHLPGRDLAFYPAVRAGRARRQWVGDVFGDQSDYARHALVSRSHRTDVVMAVGPATADELRFLGPEMDRADVRTVYNGVPSVALTVEAKAAARRRVDAWLLAVTGRTFDYLITHVTRPVVSKGLWRDARVGAAIEPMLARAGKTAAYVLLTCGADTRSPDQVSTMAREYGWPLHHREGHPDLSPIEAVVHRAMDAFEHTEAHERARAITPILVNQFGFDRERLGPAAPDDLSMGDLRAAADAELGLAVYEPFGIAPLEPLHAGAVCVVSRVSGCLGLAERALAAESLTEESCPVLLAVDFTEDAALASDDPGRCAALTTADRERVEADVCALTARRLFERLPKSPADRARYLELGQRLARRMSWAAVVESDLLPALRAAYAKA